MGKGGQSQQSPSSQWRVSSKRGVGRGPDSYSWRVRLSHTSCVDRLLTRLAVLSISAGKASIWYRGEVVLASLKQHWAVRSFLHPRHHPVAAIPRPYPSVQGQTPTSVLDSGQISQLLSSHPWSSPVQNQQAAWHAVLTHARTQLFSANSRSLWISTQQACQFSTQGDTQSLFAFLCSRQSQYRTWLQNLIYSKTRSLPSQEKAWRYKWGGCIYSFALLLSDTFRFHSSAYFRALTFHSGSLPQQQAGDNFWSRGWWGKELGLIHESQSF